MDAIILTVKLIYMILDFHLFEYQAFIFDQHFKNIYISELQSLLSIQFFS
jgi:hypothetical protein